MSAGFGSSGQKRTPEKVVMEPSESIYQQNRRNMVGTIPPPLLSRWAQGPPLPWETNWRTGARQLGLPWGGTHKPRGRRQPHPARSRGRCWWGGNRPSQLSNPRREGPRSAAKWSAPLETKFLRFATRQEQDTVLSRSSA